MAQYWIPPNEKPATIAPSLVNYKRGVGTDTTALSPVTTRTDKEGPPYPYPTEAEPGNPTVIPKDLLSQFHFTFLIRHPRNSIPSYYRCTIPPLDNVTGFHNFRSDEAGYVELRHFFDFLRAEGQIGPHFAASVSDVVNGTASNGTNGSKEGVEICVIDADDLLDNPSGVIEAYCKSTGIKYEPEMLTWDTEEHHQYAKDTFEKWKGFHDDAINSKELKARTHVSHNVVSCQAPRHPETVFPPNAFFTICRSMVDKPAASESFANITKKKAPKSEEELQSEWTEKYGAEGAKIIADCVKENVEHYEYLKQFAIKV